MRTQYCDESAVPLCPRICHKVPFDEHMLAEQLKKIPANKAVPCTSVPGVCCKRLAHVLAPLLFRRMVMQWEGSVPSIPLQWRSSWLHFIPKPGRSLSQMGGWRGISLQDPLGKAVLRTVVSSAHPELLPRLMSKPQFAYLKARSYREALQRVTLHVDRVLIRTRAAEVTHHELRQGAQKQHLMGGIQLCLDVDGAFDKVSRAALEASMNVLGVPENVAALLIGWHTITPYRYRHGTYDVTVEANMGVRQGCVAAPLLWLIYTHVLLSALGMYLPLDWIQNMLTLFADDFHAAWEFATEVELEQSLRQIYDLITALKDLGLRINMDKTQVLLHLRGIRAPLWRKRLLRNLGGKMVMKLPFGKSSGREVFHIPVVSHCKYLGIMLSYTKLRDLSVRHRIKISWQRFHNLRPWWRSSALPLHRRIALWQCMIQPCLMHGLDVLGLTLRGKHVLRVCVLRQVRWIANSPLHILREPNHTLLRRLGLCDPVVQLYYISLRLWCKRWNTLSVTSSSDIMHQIFSCTFRDWSGDDVGGTK